MMDSSPTPALPETGPAKAHNGRGRRLVWTMGAAILVVSVAVAAGISIRQDVAFTPAAQASDVRFVDGGGGLPGFATATIGSSAASATVTLTGIAGATMQVTDLLRIQNVDETQAYSVTLLRSEAPNAAITGLTFTVLNGATTVKTYDAVAAASATAFTLPAASIYDIRIDVRLADGTAAGALGTFALQFSIVPA